MSTKTSISGFLEWLPDQQLVEERFIDIARTHFERAGFTPLRCRAIETMDTLLQKGETDKEIYAVRRRGGDDAADKNSWGLHFDLTVPFARYISERLQTLVFPFRRYQIQPSWRGERPQEGRYREFIQADIDIVNRGTLPLTCDIEVIAVLLEVLRALPMPKVTLHLNNRKLMDGFFRGLDIADGADALRKIDKLAKIGEASVGELLRENLSEAQTAALLRFCRISRPDVAFVDEVRQIGIRSPLLDEGLEELVLLFEANAHAAQGRMLVDLRIARGFDYYTGTVAEGFMEGFENLGAICSGGRYDNLVAEGGRLREAYPGVGMSIGISRILGILMGRGHLAASRATPTCVLVALNNSGHTATAIRIASTLRSRGIPAEVFGQPVAYGKQIQYAEKKGIPYVWFHDVKGDQAHEVRDLGRAVQVEADLETWMPEAALLSPEIVYKGPENK